MELKPNLQALLLLGAEFSATGTEIGRLCQRMQEMTRDAEERDLNKNWDPAWGEEYAALTAQLGAAHERMGRVYVESQRLRALPDEDMGGNA
jgi:hypothetical protein